MSTKNRAASAFFDELEKIANSVRRISEYGVAPILRRASGKHGEDVLDYTSRGRASRGWTRSRSREFGTVGERKAAQETGAVGPDTTPGSDTPVEKKRHATLAALTEKYKHLKSRGPGR